MYREKLWWKRCRPRELYPDASCKDAHVPRDLPIPNSNCGRPTLVFQSGHPVTVVHCFYTCSSFNISIFHFHFLFLVDFY
jgi:hypothetical protein